MNTNNKKTLLKNVAVGAGVLGISGLLTNAAWGMSSAGEPNELIISPNANQELDANGVEPNDAAEITPSTETATAVYTSLPVAESTHEHQSFADAFASARSEVGPGGIFEWNGQHYGTYYKEEWEGLSEEAKHDFSNSVFEEPVQADVVDTYQPTDMVVDDTHSFADAFASARAELGAGHTFEWNGHTYNTYYEHEWNNLSSDDKQGFAHTNHTEEVFSVTNGIAENDADPRANNVIETEEDFSDAIVDTKEEHHSNFHADANANVIMDEEAIVSTNDEVAEDVAIDDHANAIPIEDEHYGHDDAGAGDIIADLF